MYILGINSAYHEPSACLIKDGTIIAAVEEERFNRVRHGKPANLLNPHILPEKSIQFCLKKAGIESKDIDHIGFSFDPELRFQYNTALNENAYPGFAGSLEGEEIFYHLLKAIPNKLSSLFGYDVSNKFQWIKHHLCHASSAYFVSPFQESAILSVDGIGEAASIWIGKGDGNRIQKIKTISYPNSLGLIWTKLSRFLGFGEYGQWKVMGLAAYGNEEVYSPLFKKLINFDNGELLINNDVLQFRKAGENNDIEFEQLMKLFGKYRNQDEEIEERHKDIAAALQKITNEIMLALAKFAKDQTNSKNLCIAGGVGLNCVSNNFLDEQNLFDEIFIQPAANDAGTALGACFYLWNHVLLNPKQSILENVYFGPEYSKDEIHEQISQLGIEHAVVSNDKSLINDVAVLLARGEIVAWFQNKMEFGPRALGNRSILADPRRADMVHLINDKIKHREFFRPFACSILEQETEKWFEIPHPSSCDKFMLFSRKVKQEKLGLIPAVTHIDNTSRIQKVSMHENQKYFELIEAFFKITDIPLLLNTSFNDQEPIICSPNDALITCIESEIRWLVLGDYMIDLSLISKKLTDVLLEPIKSIRVEKEFNEFDFNYEKLNKPVKLVFRSR